MVTCQWSFENYTRSNKDNQILKHVENQNNKQGGVKLIYLKVRFHITEDI